MSEINKKEYESKLIQDFDKIKEKFDSFSFIKTKHIEFIKDLIAGILIFIIMFLFFMIMPVRGASRNEIRIANVAGNAASTLLRGILEGKVKNIGDVGKMLVGGGVSGLAFYEAKKMVGRGDAFAGVALANIAASVAENTATGRHPLARIGYTIGPVRVHIPVFEKGVRVDVNPASLMRLGYCMNQKIKFKNGVIGFESDDIENPCLKGYAVGLYPVVREGARNLVYNHEMIHVIQNMQIHASSPEPLLKKGFRFGAIQLAIDFSIDRFGGYRDNWKEIEAWEMNHD